MAVINYTQLIDLKTYLWISGTAQDIRLNAFLLQSYYSLNSILWTDTLNLSTKFETVEKMYTDWTIFLHSFPVVSIDTIDWKVYTWVHWVDYQITRKRKVRIKDIFNYMTDLEFYNIDFTYTAWYNRDETWTVPWPNDELPLDISLLQMMLVDWMLNKAWSEWLWAISQYKLWEEQITYWGSRWNKAQEGMKVNDIPTFQSLLSKYMLQDVYSI